MAARLPVIAAQVEGVAEVLGELADDECRRDIGAECCDDCTHFTERDAHIAICQAVEAMAEPVIAAMPRNSSQTRKPGQKKDSITPQG